MEIRVLGPLVVQVGTEELPVGGPMRKAVLLRLALSPDHWLDAQRLSDAVWGGDLAPGAANRLQAQIALLRRTLGPERLLTEGSSYRLDREGVAVDSELFERDVAAARALLHAGQVVEAAELSRTALARWRGSPLIDVEAHDWATPAITYLTELKGIAHVVLLESLLIAVETCRAYGQPTSMAGSLAALGMAYSKSDPHRSLEVLAEATSIASAARVVWTEGQIQHIRCSVQASLAKGASSEIVDRTVDEWVEQVAASGNLATRWRILASIAPLLLNRSAHDVATAVGIFRARHVDDRRGSWARGVERAADQLGPAEFERLVEHGRTLGDADAIAHLRGR